MRGTTKSFQRAALFLCCLACGIVVFVVFSHYFPVMNGLADRLGRMLAATALLAAALAARRSERFKPYWLVLFAYFTALAAISLDYYLGLSRWFLPVLGINKITPAGLALDKLESSLLGILIVLGLNRLAGQGAGALYIRRGRLWLGLGVGLVALAAMTAWLIPITSLFFNGQNLSWARILPWMPWVLIMALANASNEELIFRGQFIGRLEPLTGRLAANLVTTIPFVWAHVPVDYPADAFIFLALQLLPLSLAWCWLMQKTKSIWGSILFHAAMDIPVFVGIFSTL